MTEQRIATSRIPQLELLRVMATVSIFVFHLWTVIPLSSDVALVGAVLARLPLLGTLGVIGFNCITGFMLSAALLGQHTQRSILPTLDFFRYRFGRICLHYYPTLVLWTVLWLLPAVQDHSGLFVLIAFVAHLVFVHTLHASTFFTIVPAFWWLGMLAHFYLVFPWLLRFFEGVGPGRACVMAASSHG